MKIFKLDRESVRRGMWLALVMMVAFSETRELRAQLAIRAGVLHTMAGEPIPDGVVLVRGRTIEAVGKAGSLVIPEGYRVIRARVATPGLIDAHSAVGLSGMLNQSHDQEQLERSAPVQPELRAFDGYNARDPLIDWVRSLGVTTLHTGHAPGALVSGQTMIVKTHPANVDRAIVNPAAMIASTLGPGALAGEGGKSPGTVAKAVAMVRAELIKASEYARKRAGADPDKRPARDLKLEALTRVLDGTQPLLISVDRHQDILAALRVAAEFKLKVVLDGVADAVLVLEAIKASGFPVIVHPTMARASAQRENLSWETAARLKEAGIPFALQSSFEGYVPKTRVVLFEAAAAAANGLSFHDALASITIDAATLLGVAHRVGSLEVGKDADIALYDGDPFEYTSHCVGVVVSGVVTDQDPK